MNARENRVPIILWLIISFLSIGFILFFFVTSPASASYIFGPTPTATQENLWAYADVPKPTRPVATALPTMTLAPTETAIPAATETPAVVAMELVDDAAVRVQNPQEPLPVPSTGGG
ncbi:MAG TPA: hypothetical protein VFY66_03525, partial [Anaerolineales bacterium]|nr:hypothetical protein [Anaerolineales bacterium]